MTSALLGRMSPAQAGRTTPTMQLEAVTAVGTRRHSLDARATTTRHKMNSAWNAQSNVGARRPWDGRFRLKAVFTLQ